MDGNERQRVRDAFIVNGFDRTGFTDDLKSVGDYTEYWQHKDGSKIALEWAPKDKS